MPLSHVAQFSKTVTRSLTLFALACAAVVLGIATFLYQKVVVETTSSRGIARLQTSSSCTAPTQASATNENKQLFVSCAGFLD
jgi:hypothetical protein